MKVITNDVLAAEQALNDLGTVELPATLSFKLSKFRKSLTAVIDSFNEASKKVFEKYSEAGAEGEEPRVPADKVKVYQKDMEKILQMENKLSSEMINISEFEGVKIKNSIIMRLAFILKA